MFCLKRQLKLYSVTAVYSKRNLLSAQKPNLFQDLSQIDSGNFVSSSGLTDVSNVLEKEIRKMQMKLGVSDISLQQAQNQASYLESLAYQMEL